MKIENKIIADKKYLSEVMNKLPSNVLLNKGVTGCGGTYLELTSKRNSIILVPSIELAKNKSKPEYLIVHGKIKNEEIDKYLNSSFIEYKKIIGTYDCLKRLLENRDYLLNFFLLIDEYHILFNSYSFRNTPILYILRNYNKFKEYCFMTATPLDDNIILDEIKELNRVNIVWNNATKIKLNLIDTSFTNKELSKIITSVPDNVNYHIFLNSLKTIKDLVTKLNLENYKVVCSETSSKNNKTLKTGSTLDAICKYNFYTATAFEGCDIFDPNGKTIILCDTNIATTILDISTLVRQICGRLRDSVFKEEITLILNTSKHRYAGTSSNLFNAKVLDNISMGKYKENKFNNDPDPEYKNAELRSYNDNFNSFYINKMDDIIFYDDNLRKMDEYNYKLITSIYNDSISVLKEATLNNFDASIIPTSKSNWILDKLGKQEYSYTELEELFKEDFEEKRNITFNGFTIKDYFPEFEKSRKTKKGIKQTYYKFKI